MDLLERAESLDNYRKLCSQNSVNQEARASHSYVPMSTDVKSGAYGSKIVTLYPNADAGLPHTRPPNLICVPSYFPMNNETMLHELLHLHQRDHLFEWEGKFLQQGWRPISEKEIPERWRRRCRLNPDTLDRPFYAWQDRWVPLPLFEREDKPDLRQCVVRWWDKSTGSLTNDAPESFVRAFGKNHPQAEHPREVSAVILSRQFRNSTWDELEDYLRSFLVSE